VWHGSAQWRHGPLTLRLSVQNLFNADYFIGADPTFSHNDLVTKAPPAAMKLIVVWSF
ncbi:MAG: hypothetical protein HYV75_03105, partial [Opitutae bacterium]|nr:hypothetical protein [Opitutae bacterium]